MGEDNVIGRLRARALIVSENKFAARLVRELLFGIGIGEIEDATTVADAEAALKEHSFDVVIADFGPATFDPAPAIKAMRALPDFQQAHTPVVALLADTDQSRLREIKAAKIEFAVMKPISAGVFSDRVVRALRHRWSRRGPEIPGRTILLLSSNPKIGHYVRAALPGDQRYDVEIACDHGMARQSLEDDPIDLIIVDGASGPYDCLKTVQWLRHQTERAYGDLPVLFLAPHGADVPTLPVELRISAVIPKNFETGALAQAITAATSGPAGAADGAGSEDAPPASADVPEDTVWVV